MHNKNRLVKISFLIILVAVFAASCTTRPTPEPTVDVNMLATQAAQTIEARFTETALAMPSETPMPTYTPIVATATIGTIPITLPTTGVGAIPTVAAQSTLPAALPTATLSAVGDRAVWADQSIKDGTKLKPGESADLIWYITNVGTTTWTTDYSVRFFTGTNFAKAGNNRYAFPASVAPQQTGSVTIDIVAPTTPGEYKMAWVLSNAEDRNFYTVDITIVVGE
ncbi:MAG: hypothetical protein GX933_06365 [Chloroflexi bacterium]|jgi:uncharacterized cupredoxin-like copper-binding protein|nr:hypothetical protein [Chloroflexota bacterium]